MDSLALNSKNSLPNQQGYIFIADFLWFLDKSRGQ